MFCSRDLDVLLAQRIIGFFYLNYPQINQVGKSITWYPFCVISVRCGWTLYHSDVTERKSNALILYIHVHVCCFEWNGTLLQNLWSGLCRCFVSRSRDTGTQFDNFIKMLQFQDGAWKREEKYYFFLFGFSSEKVLLKLQNDAVLLFEQRGTMPRLLSVGKVLSIWKVTTVLILKFMFFFVCVCVSQGEGKNQRKRRSLEKNRRTSAEESRRKCELSFHC